MTEWGPENLHCQSASGNIKYQHGNADRGYSETAYRNKLSIEYVSWRFHSGFWFFLTKHMLEIFEYIGLFFTYGVQVDFWLFTVNIWKQ